MLNCDLVMKNCFFVCFCHTLYDNIFVGGFVLEIRRCKYLNVPYCFDEDEAREKVIATKKYIQKQNRKSLFCTLTLYFCILGIPLTLLCSVFVMAYKFFICRFRIGIQDVFYELMWTAIIVLLLSITALLCYFVTIELDSRDKYYYYSNAEIFLDVSKKRIIDSFIVCDMYVADLYLLYVTVDEDDNELTRVFIIPDFDVQIANNIKEPMLDIDNDIYYIPRGYKHRLKK